MVAVLNPLLIPSRMDVVIGDHYFEFEFEVEKKGIDENGEEMEVDWNGGEGDGEGGGEQSPEQRSLDKRDPKRQKGFDKESKEGNGEGKNTQSDLQGAELNLNAESFKK